MSLEDERLVVKHFLSSIDVYIKYQSLSRIFEAIVGKFDPEISLPIRAFLVKNILHLKSTRDQFFLYKKLLLSNKEASLFRTISQIISKIFLEFVSDRNGSLICSELISILLTKSENFTAKRECLELLYNSITDYFVALCELKSSYDVFQVMLTDDKFHENLLKSIKQNDLLLIVKSNYGTKLLHKALQMFNLRNKQELYTLLLTSKYKECKALKDISNYIEEYYHIGPESISSQHYPNMSLCSSKAQLDYSFVPRYPALATIAPCILVNPYVYENNNLRSFYLTHPMQFNLLHQPQVYFASQGSLNNNRIFRKNQATNQRPGSQVNPISQMIDKNVYHSKK